MHLSSEVALDLIEARNTGSESDFWRSHIETCVDCRERMTDWTGVHSLLTRRSLRNAPEPLLRVAENLFEQPVRAGRPSIRKMLATLVFDSFAQPGLAGARGAAMAARQMVLRAEGFDIHLRIWAEPPGRKMVGQILARKDGGSVEGTRLHLLHDEERCETVMADKFGEFEFQEVPDGPLNLQIDLPFLTVVGALDTDQTL